MLTDDQKAFILDRTYYLCNGPKDFYEPNGKDETTETIRLASIPDHMNVLVQFVPNDLVPPE